VICVDWKQLTYDLFYASAKINVKYIGYDIAKVLTILTNNMKVGSENIHLIGHGMGAHVVGYTGKKLNGQIPRITGIYSIYYTRLMLFVLRNVIVKSSSLLENESYFFSSENSSYITI